MANKQKQTVDNVENLSPEDNFDKEIEGALKPTNTEVVETDNQIDYSKEQQIYNELLNKYQGGHEKTIFEFCYKTNIPYCDNIIKALFKGHNDEILNQMPIIYIKTLNEDSHYQGLTFFAQLKRENFEAIYSEDLSALTLSEEDKKNRMAVIDILSYDPFKDDDPSSKPQLYRDMSSMLTEGMRKDVAKAKAALTIVRSYNNIEKYQKKINEIMKTGNTDEDTQKQLDQLIKIQKTLQDSINTTAEKNNFTVKGIGNAGKGMLSDVMNQIGERGIDEGITNFYDIATSKSIEEIANISMKAQLNQISLSKTDYADILKTQIELVQEAQRKSKDALEALRLAKEKIVKQELLDELTQDYRKKGISEKEIEEFISREYHLYDIDGDKN